MVGYGWPILLAGLAFAVNETLDKILLENWLPMTEKQARGVVGSYTAGYRLAVGMTLFAQAFRLGVEPFFFSQSQEKNALQQYALITKAFVSLGSIALVAYVVLVDLIAPIIVDENVTAAMDVIPLVLIAYFFSGIYQSLSVWYKIQDKTLYGAYISVAAAVLTIAMNCVLIPRIGYMASAYATCAAYGLMMLISYFVGRKHLAVPYDLGSLVLYSGAVHCVMPGIFLHRAPATGHSEHSHLCSRCRYGSSDAGISKLSRKRTHQKAHCQKITAEKQF